MGIFNTTGRKFRSSRGFGLIDAAILVFIASSATLGYLAWTRPAMSTNAEMTIETNRKIQTIALALETFLVEKGRLPCPANPYMLSDNSRNSSAPDDIYQNNFGKEDLDVTSDTLNNVTTYGVDCPVTVGAIPVYSIGLEQDYMSDAWGNRFTYQVSKNVCGSDVGVENGLTTEESAIIGCTRQSYVRGLGDITVQDKVNDAVYVIVSHGINGYGAFMQNGEQRAASSNPDEVENSNNYTSGDKIFKAEAGDDIVFFRTKVQMERFTDRRGTRQISVEKCEENSQAMKNITSTVSGFMASDITGFERGENNSGEQLALGIMKTMQNMCVAYYGYKPDVIAGKTWSGAQCPGNKDPSINGTTYYAPTDTCTCEGGKWDGNCKFDPAIIERMIPSAGMQLWLDANDKKTIFASTSCATAVPSGGEVRCWKDKSGNNLSATQSGNAPVYQSAVINNRGILRFSTNQYLSVPYISTVNSSIHTAFAVVRINGSAGTNRSIITSRDAVSSVAMKGFQLYAGASNKWAFVKGNGVSGMDWLYSTETTAINQTVIIAAINNSGASSLYINGASPQNMGGNYTVNSTREMRIGAGTTEGVAQDFFNGDIAEIMLFNKAFNASDRQAIEQYLSLKWGVTIQ